jgi:hypothetical protein
MSRLHPRWFPFNRDNVVNPIGYINASIYGRITTEEIEKGCAAVARANFNDDDRRALALIRGELMQTAGEAECDTIVEHRPNKPKAVK